MLIRSPKQWELPERIATPESVFWNRRSVLKQLGFSGMGIWGLLNGCSANSSAQGQERSLKETLPSSAPPYPAPRNNAYAVGSPLTPETIAASYNNFYEFTTDKDRVWRLAQQLKTDPWRIAVEGEVAAKRELEFSEFLRNFQLEERVYRFRCVEAWSMVVPWTGVPFRDVIAALKPTGAARYVRFVTFLDRSMAPGQRQPWYPWPYYEALTMAEAMHPLTMLVTGSYGHALPNQHGAPLRLIAPWKYGFKSIKSIARIEFLRELPSTFWSDLTPSEYDFWANVDPGKPHPRWSQATERDIATGNRRRTEPFNGYAEEVSTLYSG